MFELTFSVNGKSITKTAKKESEVRRLVYLYSNGNHAEKEAMIKEVIASKNENVFVNEFKNK